MALYVTLFQFTDQGMRNVKESPKRLEANIKAATSMGIKILGAYYTMGAYDVVTIAEIEDEQLATAFGLASLAQGNVRATTMRALTPAEFAEIVQKMP
jgi:uncharacterized protein with GYD domain